MVSINLKRFGFAGMLALCSIIQVYAQDTLHISLAEAEKRFFQNNLQLLAERYNIDVASAQIIQARLYTNPNISFTGNIYNPDQKKWIDVSNRTGEYGIGIQQLIILAGKRMKQVKLAETTAMQAQNTFFDLMRNLHYTLRSNFYNIYFLQLSANAYKIQIASLQKLNAAYQELLLKGVVTLKDAVRIKSLLYSLQAEQTALQNQINDLESELRLLLHENNVYLLPDVGDLKSSGPISSFSLRRITDSAYVNRYDLRLSENNLLYNQQDYSLQKALRVPDLTLGAQFDKRGSFVNNASFFSAAIDLPFFNRNQGKIKAAKISIDLGRAQLNLQRFTIENEVQKAYTKALTTEKMLQTFDPGFKLQLDLLLQGVTENFQKHNISLIEFTDFYQSYKDNILQLNQLQYARMQAIEDLNFAAGKPVINQ
ncbi:MAG: TolC family protein [Chitinophagaceae bacterium]